MDRISPERSETWLGALWRPPKTRDLFIGLGLAAVLPWAASWMATDLSIFSIFPGLTFVAATVAATMVGRLSASVVATVTSAVLISYNHLLPQEDGLENALLNLLALAFFCAASFLLAYALAQKDAASERAAAARSEIERLAGEVAAERNTMRQILHQMPAGVIVTDAQGTITMANRRAVEILRVQVPIGQPLHDYIGETEDTIRPVRENGTAYSPAEVPLARALATGELVLQETMRVERADGSSVIVEVDAAPIRRAGSDTIEGGIASFQDVTERIRTEEDLARTSKRLSQIQTVTDAALAGLGVDELTGELLRKVRQVLDTDSATLLLVDRTGSALIEHTTIGAETDGATVAIPIGRGVAGKIASTVTPIVADDLSTYEVERPWLTEQMRSLMGVPLVYRGEVRGVIHVATRSQRHFTADDMEVAELVANRIAAALDRAALYESRSAMSQELQRSLLPSSLPQIEGVELAALYHPFSPDQAIGGDFYDIYHHGEGTWGVVVGDVSGKGPKAAAIMGLAAHTVRALARYESKPSAVLTALNEVLLREERVNEEQFCTACEMRLKVEPGHLRITLCSAGHPLPMVLRANGAIEQVGEPGTLLGSFRDLALHDVVLDLGPGDALVAFTDGLVERRDDGIDEGQRALAELLSTCTELSASEIKARIERDLVQTTTLDDDVAVFVIRKT
jgi:phosphoserine phosphatase RsbU/P